MSNYDARVDELAAELLEPDVDGGRQASPELEARIHELLSLIARVVNDHESEVVRPHYSRGAYKANTTRRLRLVG